MENKEIMKTLENNETGTVAALTKVYETFGDVQQVFLNYIVELLEDEFKGIDTNQKLFILFLVIDQLKITADDIKRVL